MEEVIEKLKLEPNDILVIRAKNPKDVFPIRNRLELIAKSLEKQLGFQPTIIVINGAIEGVAVLDEKAMNRLGWYRNGEM